MASENQTTGDWWEKPQTHQDTLRLMLQHDRMYAHEADAIEAAIAALDKADWMSLPLSETGSHE